MATRAEIRLALGDDLNDVLPITVTTNAANSTKRLYAIGQINAGAESNAGREIIFTSGANLGLIRRVIATNPREGWIDLDRAVDATIADGDTAEMYGFRGRGYRIDQLHREINRAIADAHPAHKGTPMTVAVTDPFDAENPVVAVPAALNWVAAVEYEDANGTWRTVPMAEDRLMRGWSVDLPNESLLFRDRSILSMLDGRTLRMVGFQRSQPLTSETDTTTVPTQYIIDRCMARMLMADPERVDQGYNRGLIGREDTLRSKLSIRTRGLGARAKFIRD